MESSKTAKKIRWYHYVLGLFIIGVIGKACEDKSKKEPTTNKVSTSADAFTDTTNYTPIEESAKKEPLTKWNYSEDSDKMTSKTIYYAEIQSENTLNFEFPYNGGSQPSLLIRKKGSTDIILRISKGQFINSYDGVPVRLRFDEEPAFTVTANSAADGSSDILFLGSVSKILQKLKGHQKLIIEAQFYNEGNRTMDFDIEGFEWKH